MHLQQLNYKHQLINAQNHQNFPRFGCGMYFIHRFLSCLCGTLGSIQKKKRKKENERTNKLNGHMKSDVWVFVCICVSRLTGAFCLPFSRVRSLILNVWAYLTNIHITHNTPKYIELKRNEKQNKAKRKKKKLTFQC